MANDRYWGWDVCSSKFDLSRPGASWLATLRGWFGRAVFYYRNDRRKGGRSHGLSWLARRVSKTTYAKVLSQFFAETLGTPLLL